MLRQYHAQRGAGGFNPFGAGTVRIGTILYLQDRVDRYIGPVCRNPWIVVAWCNREYFPAVPGALRVTYMAGGHLAVVKSLRDGRTLRVSDHYLLRAVDLDCEHSDAAYELPPTNGRLPLPVAKPGKRARQCRKVA